MLRVLTSVAVLFIWSALFATDAADDSGLINDAGLDQSVDAVLADFGQAVKIYRTLQANVVSTSALTTFTHLLKYLTPSLYFDLDVSTGLLHRTSQPSLLTGLHLKLHEVLQVLLI